jgi:hypothetical protein
MKTSQFSRKEIMEWPQGLHQQHPPKEFVEEKK